LYDTKANSDEKAVLELLAKPAIKLNFSDVFENNRANRFLFATCVLFTNCADLLELVSTNC